MTVRSVSWDNERYDVHVLEGHPYELGRHLVVDDGTAPAPRGDRPPAGVTVRFTGLYLGAVGAHHVTVVPDTGRIVAAVRTRPIPPTDPYLASFQVEVVVTDTTVTPHATFIPGRIRVNVHASLIAVWLSPARLTIRPGADGQRFSVLARFDDGYGDLTRSEGLLWNVLAPAAGVQADVATGALRAVTPAATPGAHATVQVTLPMAYGGVPGVSLLSARAEVVVGQPWATPLAAGTLPQVRPARPNPRPIADTPNILFLPEGFTAADEPLFHRMVDQAVRGFSRPFAPRPFNLLARRLNYWKTFIPSPEQGATVLSELVRTTVGGVTLGNEQEVVRSRVGFTGATWELGHLVEAVGFPTDEDIMLGSAEVRQKWDALYGPTITAHVNDALIDTWKALGPRVLANERDTAFGFSFGGRPMYDDYAVQAAREVRFHRLRTTRAHVDQMLRELRDPSGARIGGTWGDATGKDWQLVVFLVLGPRSGGVRTADGIVCSVVDFDDVPLTARPSATYLEYECGPVVATDFMSPRLLVRLVTHELAHALGVGDEYGTNLRPTGSAATIVAPYPNLQDEAAVRAGSTTTFNPDLIRWRFHRIWKAAALAAAPRAVGSAFELDLQALPANTFVVGDLVRLRRRPLTSAADPVSDQLRVTQPLRGRTLTVQPTAGATFAPGAWPAGSVVFVPHTHPARPTEELRLVSPPIAEHLRASGKPLNAAPTGAHACAVNDRAEQYPRNLPAALRARWLHTPELIGLYDGGAEYHCGIYHPSGRCIMRSDRSLGTFCHVCRYVIVDVLDPTKHGEMDAAYDAFYPL
jgi:hypothetical protein